MNMTLVEKIFGVNWRSTLSGIGTAIMGLLAMLAAAPYELGEVATLIPPDWKPVLLKASLVSAAILHVIKSVNSKDKQIVGNGTIEDPNKVKIKNEDVSRIVSILLACILLSGCAGSGYSVRGSVSYVTSQGTLRVGSDGKNILIDAIFDGKRTRQLQDTRVKQPTIEKRSDKVLPGFV